VRKGVSLPFAVPVLLLSFSNGLTYVEELWLEETKNNRSVAELTQRRSCVCTIESPLNCPIVEHVSLTQLDDVGARRQRSRL